MGSDDHLVNQLIAELSSTFALKDLGEVDYFLGIQVTRTSEGILQYIKKILCKAGIQNVNTQNTPMNSGLKLSNYGSKPVQDITLYRSIVGAQQYATVTRPDLAFCTLDYGLMLKLVSDFSLDVFCDADWASDLDDRRSTTGYCIYLGGNLVTWKSQKQVTISRSSTEAEFRSLACNAQIS
ncbi:hypothetical protein CsatB_010523 [Cannabis sativa]